MATETVEAPMPGVFYRRPDPEDPVLVEEGDEVEAGDVVCLVGVMKNFHEIETESSGVVERIVAENEQEIEAGDDLIEIEVE